MMYAKSILPLAYFLRKRISVRKNFFRIDAYPILLLVSAVNRKSLTGKQLVKVDRLNIPLNHLLPAEVPLGINIYKPFREAIP